MEGLLADDQNLRLKFQLLDSRYIKYDYTKEKKFIFLEQDKKIIESNFENSSIFTIQEQSMEDIILANNQISVQENTKVKEIKKEGNNFIVVSEQGEQFKTNKVLLAIGRRGSPRKLNVKGEEMEKVAYRLLEPELILGKKVLVVGGGDSAIENALLLVPQNTVTLSYRSETFNRLKPKNATRIKEAIESKSLRMEFSTTVSSISENEVALERDGEIIKIENDLVYIFAGGELPTQFLEKSGIEITKRFGYTMKSHAS